MNHITHKILSKLGFRLYKKPFLPKGVDWLWDIYRLTQHQPPSVFMDVGANQGQTALAIHAQFPSAIIHSFEPIESTFSQIKQNTSHVPQIVPVNKAVGEVSGKVQFQLYQSTSLLNRVATQEEISRGNYLEEVEMISLREYCKQMGITRVDVLKTDAQGYDVSVLNFTRCRATVYSIYFC
ncbi:FkbM family methyltransferase [Coleofasciculus sp. F4-SAH-05]|uniref:FkbM family methyltransferase n=1 Tax=Coleofasciculus sp. F4-SAH-05 TaxID=3069525 RepID=UPI0032F420D3